MDREIKPKIENMVAAITLDQKLDLKKLAKSEPDAIYTPKRFPGIIYRMHEPRLGTLIFNSGKVICSGATSRKQISIGVKKLKAKLSEHGIYIKAKPLVKIQNIVASASLGFGVNLDVLSVGCDNTEYEPEQFPGLVFRLAEPKTVMLVFRSGKIVITGAKTIKDVKIAAEKTKSVVEAYTLN